MKIGIPLNRALGTSIPILVLVFALGARMGQTDGHVLDANLAISGAPTFIVVENARFAVGISTLSAT